MRVKQTAKKITSSGEEMETSSLPIDQENVNNNSDNPNDLSDSEVEIVVECRRDTDGNQFLLDGTLVIEPAPVPENSNNPDKSKLNVEEIGFADFIQEMQIAASDKVNNIVSSQPIAKKLVPTSVQHVNPQITVKCTACNMKFNPYVGNSLHKHPVLGVILCHECIENQKDKYFVIDEEDNKETLCRWCVEGGSLICCDFCSKSYCKTCIKRNLGRTVLSEILNQDDSVQWKCFSCDPTPIKILQEACSKVFVDINAMNESRRKAQLKVANKKPLPRIESVNKKRSFGKIFPATTPKIAASIHQSVNPNLNTINLLNNMEGFGTEWYLRNVNLENILTGIDKVDSRSLLNAINSTKKCVEAFYSDIRNLENEISKAASSTDILAIVSMFKSVYRHHIFNRFCQIQSRIEEDKKTRFVPQTLNGNGSSSGSIASQKDLIQNTNIPNLMINSVISNAQTNTIRRPPVNHHSFTPNLIAKGMRPLSNGDHRHSMPAMMSIDLTDDVDIPAKRRIVDKIIEKVTEEILESKPNEIVDLCNDDDTSSAVSSYPVVSMNINNQLFDGADTTS